ncbi:MAG: DMT family transporter [Paracoccaceae bacterium]
MTQTLEITWRSWAMIAILGVTWGATFMVTEIALRGITPYWLAALRISFATILMIPIWQLRCRVLFEGPVTAQIWRAVIVIGLLSSALPFMLLAWGQQYVTSGFAGVSMAAVTLIVVPMAHFLIPGEAMTLRRTIGFLIGFIGVCLLIGGQAFDTSGSELEWAGRLACLAAAGCYGASSVMMRRLPKVDPVGLSTVLLIIAAPIVVGIAVLQEGPPPLPDMQTLVVIAFLGLVPTAAANLLRVLVVRSAGPVFMSLTNYQVPIWSVLLGAWLLNEPLPGSLMIALTLILAGVCLSQWGGLVRLFRRQLK